ncbi:hypothetical protein [Tautonia plasticadhaerens]|uniref:DUF3352 domain-containing protein n=1 Tax=Tautonia plasticadhaerens TaxID=2527974 RepID=A0A518GXR7_9BACT|nr:hypothetical protein [Tautonia plasticadhaerens]QDV33381.1 hypothetical protein ElP_12520 [Tautonia plasticadhaerens]
MIGTFGRRAVATIGAAVVWTSAIPSALAGAREAGHGADLLGPETLAYVELSRPGVLLDRLTGDRAMGLIEAVPGYAEALESSRFGEFRRLVEFVSGQLDTTWDEGLRALSGGGIVLGVEEANPPRLVLVVTPEDPGFLDRAHAKLVELARRDAEEKGAPDPIGESEYRGLTAYRVSDEEAHVILDGRLVLANGLDGLKSVVDRHLDGGDRLSDSDAFEGRRPEDTPLAWAYARLDRLRELDPDRFRADEPDDGAMLLIGAWIEHIQTAPWASAWLDWDEDRLAAALTVATPEDGRSEVMARFLPAEGDGAPAPIEFEGRLATINLWRDQYTLWHVREDLLPPEALQGLAQLDSLAGTFFGGRDFGDSVLEPLGSHWQLVAAMQDFGSMDPEPSLKLPSFAMVVELDADRPEFAQRLRVAFQSFLGLANLGGAETGAPPLMLGSETHEGIPISLATFMAAPEAPGEGDEEGGEDPAEVHYRNNFSPSVAEVEGRFIVSSSVGLTRSLIDALKADPGPDPTDATLLMTADGPALAGLVELNRERLVLRNMLERGNDRDAAEREVATLAALLRTLGLGELRLEDGEDASTLVLEFDLGRP